MYFYYLKIHSYYISFSFFKEKKSSFDCPTNWIMRSGLYLTSFRMNLYGLKGKHPNQKVTLVPNLLKMICKSDKKKANKQKETKGITELLTTTLSLPPTTTLPWFSLI